MAPDSFQPVNDHLRCAQTRPDTIHLLTKQIRARQTIGSPPHSLRLRLDAGNGVNTTTPSAPERALHLGCEVDVTGGVDNIYLMIVPETGRRRGNGNTAFLL
jgi:hypothetical protein